MSTSGAALLLNTEGVFTAVVAWVVFGKLSPVWVVLLAALAGVLLPLA